MEYLNTPTGLSDRAKQFYQELVKELDNQNVIQNLDASLLFVTAHTWDCYMLAIESVQKDGLTYTSVDPLTKKFLIKPNPAVHMQTDFQIQLMKCFSELGLSPRSRKQLKAIIMEAGGEESPLEKFLSKSQVEN